VQHIEVSGLSSLPDPVLEEAPPLDWATAADRGRQYFLGACGNCHNLAGEVGVGPPLNGVVGRRIAAVPGFRYSAELAGRGGTWTEPMLHSYIANPKAFAPGTSMPNPGITLPLVKDIVAYLKTTGETLEKQPRAERLPKHTER
jgi:cytochrome c